MNALRSLRWRLRTWLNQRFWNQPIEIVTKPIKSKIIVGLTTSPQRIKHLEPVLKSILRQSCPPDEIHLNIPHIFKRDGSTYVIPDFVNKLDSKIKVVRVEDIGPGTKIIPTLLKLADTSDTLVITADDDILMLPQTIEVIAKAFHKDPSTVYGLSGYRLGTQMNSLYSNEPSKVDVLEGYAHFAVHRKFISGDFTNYLKIAHSTPAGFLHDDVVMANYFALKGVPLIQLFEKDANRRILRFRGAQLFYGIDSDALHNGGGQDLLNFSGLNQTKQAQKIANVLRKQDLWAIRSADGSN